LYTGFAPVFIPVASKVTCEPWQVGSGSVVGAIVTLTGELGITVKVTVFEVAGFP
jgi:predicted acyltransferase (DUF342 family)